eukprot:8518188-Pyramimonas_sp.AAC.1
MSYQNNQAGVTEAAPLAERLLLAHSAQHARIVHARARAENARRSARMHMRACAHCRRRPHTPCTQSHGACARQRTRVPLQLTR